MPALEADHAAQVQSGVQVGVGLVDLFELVRPADQLAQLQRPPGIELQHQWDLACRTAHPVEGALDPLFTHGEIEQRDRDASQVVVAGAGGDVGLAEVFAGDDTDADDRGVGALPIGDRSSASVRGESLEPGLPP